MMDDRAMTITEGRSKRRCCPALNKKGRRQPLLRCKTTGRPDSPSEGSGWHGGQLFLFRRPARRFFAEFRRSILRIAERGQKTHLIAASAPTQARSVSEES